MDELSADTEAAMENAVNAEFMAQSMVGLQDTFDLLLDAIADEAGLPGHGYRKFKSDYTDQIKIIENNGIGLAEDEQEGIEDIVRADYESHDVFRGSWNAAKEVNS